MGETPMRLTGKMPVLRRSDMTELNILFTCAGRRVALMETFRQALAAVGARGKLLAVDATAASPAYHKADVGLLAPRTRDEAYIPTLLEYVRRHRVALLVPMTDLDLLPLARRREEFAQAGCTVMVGSESAVAVCSSKSAVNDAIARAGLDTVHTAALDEFFAAPFYPCFAKPTHGSAGVGALRVENENQLRQHVAAHGRDLVVQEYLDGQEYTIDVYRSRDGLVRSVVPRQRLLVRSGEVEKGVTVRDDGLIDAGRRLGEAVEGLWGAFCCQCRRERDEGRIRFFEINPRFGGGMPLSIAAGANLPLYLLQEVLGLPITARLGDFTDRLLMLRYDEAVYTQVDDPRELPGYDKPQFR
ncbi:MAG: ATP-grasp domain-containing protein [Phycisphaerae bacterium]|nr:ATP-grasp domain-containing protein [Phycisphaerae bacterium]